MFVIYVDFNGNQITECKTCTLRHINCHSHCPYGVKRNMLFETIRQERMLQSDVNAYDKESKRRMHRVRSSNGMRL